MRYIKHLLLGIIALSLMGIGPFFGSIDHIDKARSSYMINCFANDQLIGAGSGNHFTYRGQKFVLTAYHVIEECDKILVVENNDQVFKLNAVVVDELLDWAVLKPEQDLVLRPVKFKRTYPKRDQ